MLKDCLNGEAEWLGGGQLVVGLLPLLLADGQCLKLVALSNQERRVQVRRG